MASRMTVTPSLEFLRCWRAPPSPQSRLRATNAPSNVLRTEAGAAGPPGPPSGSSQPRTSPNTLVDEREREVREREEREERKRVGGEREREKKRERDVRERR